MRDNSFRKKPQKSSEGDKSDQRDKQHTLEDHFEDARHPARARRDEHRSCEPMRHEYAFGLA